MNSKIKYCEGTSGWDPCEQKVTSGKRFCCDCERDYSVRRLDEIETRQSNCDYFEWVNNRQDMYELHRSMY